MCRHVRVCVCASVYMCTWRPEIKVGCLSQFSSTLLFETGSFCCTRKWLATLARHPHSRTSPTMRLQMCASVPSLAVGSNDQIQTFTLDWQVLCIAAYLPSPLTPFPTNKYILGLSMPDPAELQTHINKQQAWLAHGLLPGGSCAALDHVFGSIHQLGLTGSAELRLCSSAHSPSQPSWGMLFTCSRSPGPSRKLLLYPHSSCQGEYERILFTFSPITCAVWRALPLSSESAGIHLLANECLWLASGMGAKWY